jgi:hypothetical protein
MQQKYEFIRVCASLYDIIWARWKGTRKYDELECSDKLRGPVGKGSGLSERVAAISKRKMNLLNVHIQTKTATSNTPQTQPPYPSNSPPFIVSMSSTNEPTRRMTTRGGARDKIAKVMEHVRSGGIAEGDPNQSEDDKTSSKIKRGDKAETRKPSGQKRATATKAANTAKKPQTTKKAGGTAAKEIDMAAKKVVVAKLAQLEDRFLKKADISCRSHPC